MGLRELPTLKMDDYKRAKDELQFLTFGWVPSILKAVSCYKDCSIEELFRHLHGAVPEHAQGSVRDNLQELCKRGYILVGDQTVEGPPKFGQFRTTKVETRYRVNWKQIRQLNKAISLL